MELTIHINNSWFSENKWRFTATGDYDLTTWMGRNMVGKYECIYRYNSGNPMYVIVIDDESDAIMFKLRWAGNK